MHSIFGIKLKQVEMWLFFYFFIISEVSLAFSDDSLDILEPIIYFEKSVYKARIKDRNIEVLDGPITLQNCQHHNFYIIPVADESKYFIVPDNLNCYDNCSLCLTAFVKEGVDARDVLYDTITLQALTDRSDIITTTIMIVHSSDYDPYKLIYNIDGTEYVILNYLYFKIFLFVIVLTGIILLVLEIREVILKYKGKEYDLIAEQINYI